MSFHFNKPSSTTYERWRSDNARDSLGVVKWAVYDSTIRRKETERGSPIIAKVEINMTGQGGQKIISLFLASHDQINIQELIKRGKKNGRLVIDVNTRNHFC